MFRPCFVLLSPLIIVCNSVSYVKKYESTKVFTLNSRVRKYFFFNFYILYKLNILCVLCSSIVVCVFFHTFVLSYQKKASHFCKAVCLLSEFDD